jgi:serine/threonine-protein kinase
MSVIGTLLGERYRLDAEIGWGGMAIIYRAYDTLLDQDVATRVPSQAALDSGGRTRLLREAQSAAKLNHRNIVTVYDAGEAEGVPYVVLELVEDKTLHTRRPQDLEEILAIACQLVDTCYAEGGMPYAPFAQVLRTVLQNGGTGSPALAVV